MSRHILRGVAATVLLATVACAASAQSTVTTGAFFYRYDGPVGTPIYAGSPPFRDPAQYDSYFQNLAGTTSGRRSFLILVMKPPPPPSPEQEQRPSR